MIQPPPPSVLRRKEKSRHTKHLCSYNNLQLAEATSFQIAAAGENFLIEMYEGSSNDFRYHQFQDSVAKPKFKLARLPPTKDAVFHHIFRWYLQVQTCLGHDMLPSVWGWSLTRREVVPIKTTKKAPDHILSTLSCNCKKGCRTSICSCKKAGLNAPNFVGAVQVTLVTIPQRLNFKRKRLMVTWTSRGT